MKRRDSLLVIIDACSDRPEFGRTALQKVAYFVDVTMGLDLNHRPHYYGPFSDTVEQEVEAVVLAGMVEEKAENLGFVGTGGFPGRRYEYVVTDTGRERMSTLTKVHPSEVNQLQEFISEIVNSAGGLDQRLLSAAAKTYFIANEEGRPVSVSEVRDLARKLGWDLDADQVRRVVEILSELGLVSTA